MHRRLIAFLVVVAACPQGRDTPATPPPVDVDYAYDRDPETWRAWSYEPGMVAVAPEAEDLPYLLRPGAKPLQLRGVVLATNPLAMMSGAGYINAGGRFYAGRQATARDLGFRLQVEQRGEAFVETLREVDSTKTTVNVWSTPGQPSWHKTFTPSPENLGAALSPDGTLLAIVQSTPDRMLELSLYDVASGSRRWLTRTGGSESMSNVAYPVAFSTEGDRIVFFRFVRDSIAQIRGLDGTLIADVMGASLPERRSDKGFGFTFGLSSDCLWISRIAYSERSDSHTHATDTWGCDFDVYSTSRKRRVADTGRDPRGNALYRRIFDADPHAKDCPARVVVADGPGVSVVSYQAGAPDGAPGHVRVRTFATVPGCK